MSDNDINRIKQNIEQLQDQNAIDFQQWKRLWKEIEELEGKIKISNCNLNLLIKNIKADYESLRRIIIDENVQVQLNEKIIEINSQLDSNMKILSDGGLDRIKATGKFLTNANSWIGLINDKYIDDNAVRFYLLPTASVTTGVGGCLKIFADDYQNNADYRDLGIYFHANQNGDTGYYGNGVNWINVKVLDNGKYANKHPDLGFSFQDGNVVAGRICCFNGSKPIWVFGGATPTSQAQEIFYIAEYQDNVAFLNDKGINFLKNDKTSGCGIRVNASGDSIFSNSQTEIHAINGTTVMTLDNDKAQFEKSSYHNSNIVFNSSSNGVILKSSNGTQYKIKVSDDGILSTERI